MALVTCTTSLIRECLNDQSSSIPSFAMISYRKSKIKTHAQNRNIKTHVTCKTDLHSLYLSILIYLHFRFRVPLTSKLLNAFEHMTMLNRFVSTYTQRFSINAFLFYFVLSNANNQLFYRRPR